MTAEAKAPEMQITSDTPKELNPALAEVISVESELTTLQLRTRILAFTEGPFLPLTSDFLTGIGVLSDVPVAHGQVGEPLIKNNFFKEIFLQQTPESEALGFVEYEQIPEIFWS